MCSHFKWSVGNRPLAQALDGDDFAELISDDSLNMISEEEKCRAIIEWHKHRGARTDVAEFRRLMEYIDWTLIPEQSMFNIALAESEHAFRYLASYFFIIANVKRELLLTYPNSSAYANLSI